MREGGEPRWMGHAAPAGAGATGRDSERWYRVRLVAGGERRSAACGRAPRRSARPARPHRDPPPRPGGRPGRPRVQRERLRQQAVEAEVARRDAALKSALVDSVSHDLRTPLAGIRAAAGSSRTRIRTLARGGPRDRHAPSRTEAIRLDRMVGALLDLSRIQAGAINARREALDVEDAAGRGHRRGCGRCSARGASRSRSSATCRRSRRTRRSSTSASPTSWRTRPATRRPTVDRDPARRDAPATGS